MGNTASVAHDDKKNDDENNNNKKSKFTPFKSKKKLSSEEKKKCIGMPDSLSTQENSNDGAEKFLAPDEKDRRIEAPVDAFDDKHENQIYNIVLLRMRFPGKDKPLSGSGTIIHRKGESLYILTCAHNVMAYIKDVKMTVEAESVEFAINRRIKSYRWEELGCYSCDGWVVHPDYTKNPTPSSGNDIAILKVTIDPNDKLLTIIKPISLRTGKLDVKSYSGAKVIGFPGEKIYEEQGELWGMSGDYNLSDSNEIPPNSLIMYKCIDTSYGQSGSPIFDEKKSNNNDGNDLFTRFNKIIGVHTGGLKIAKANWGTALNEYKLKWIHNVLNVCPYMIDICDPEFSQINGDIFECTNNKPDSDYFVTFGCSVPLKPNQIHFIKIRIIEKRSYIRMGIVSDIAHLKVKSCNIPFAGNGAYYYSTSYGYIECNTARHASNRVVYQKCGANNNITMKVDLIDYKLSFQKNDEKESGAMTIEQKPNYYFFVNTYKWPSGTICTPPKCQFLGHWTSDM